MSKIEFCRILNQGAATLDYWLKTTAGREFLHSFQSPEFPQPRAHFLDFLRLKPPNKLSTRLCAQAVRFIRPEIFYVSISCREATCAPPLILNASDKIHPITSNFWLASTIPEICSSNLSTFSVASKMTQHPRSLTTGKSNRRNTPCLLFIAIQHPNILLLL